MWMPTADDQEIELMIPTNPSLEIVNVSVQHFSGCEFSYLLCCCYVIVSDWSCLGARRLLTYRKLPEGEVSLDTRIHRATDDANGVTANDLNEFRRKVIIVLYPELNFF